MNCMLRTLLSGSSDDSFLALESNSETLRISVVIPSSLLVKSRPSVSFDKTEELAINVHIHGKECYTVITCKDKFIVCAHVDNCCRYMKMSAELSANLTPWRALRNIPRFVTWDFSATALRRSRVPLQSRRERLTSNQCCLVREFIAACLIRESLRLDSIERRTLDKDRVSCSSTRTFSSPEHMKFWTKFATFIHEVMTPTIAVAVDIGSMGNEHFLFSLIGWCRIRHEWRSFLLYNTLSVRRY